MVLSLRKKSPVTPPGIDPETVQLVAQWLNHYATQAHGHRYRPKIHTYPAPKLVGHDNIPECHCRRVHPCFAFGRSRFRSAVKRLAMFGFLFVFSAPPVEFLMDKTPSHSFPKCDAITSAAKKEISLKSTRVDVFYRLMI